MVSRQGGRTRISGAKHQKEVGKKRGFFARACEQTAMTGCMALLLLVALKNFFFPSEEDGEDWS